MTESKGSAGQQASDTKRIWAISIVSSLVASALFLAFFQPVIEFLSNLVSGILAHIALGMLDSMYQQAALGSERTMLFSIFTVILSVAVGFSFFPFIYLFVSKTNFGRSMSGTESKKTFRVLMIVQCIMSVATILSVFFIVASSFIGVQASATFEQRLSISKPHLTNDQEENILSDWASMQTRADYENIMKNLELLAVQGSWNLPRRLI